MMDKFYPPLKTTKQSNSNMFLMFRREVWVIVLIFFTPSKPSIFFFLSSFLKTKKKKKKKREKKRAVPIFCLFQYIHNYFTCNILMHGHYHVLSQLNEFSSVVLSCSCFLTRPFEQKYHQYNWKTRPYHCLRQLLIWSHGSENMSILLCILCTTALQKECCHDWQNKGITY